MAALSFHTHTGSMVTLSNSSRTACRNHPHQEFNNGLILSSEPLRDNQLFEVVIDRKIAAWSGSIEMGVTNLDPSSSSTLPSSATNLRDGSLVMSGTSILQDGRAILEEYGTDLDQLGEGDRVGVMRTTSGDLHFFVNGVNQGVAASGVPAGIYAVVDMYGKCAQVTLQSDCMESRLLVNEISNENLAAAYSSVVQSSPDRLCFHERCGLLITLSCHNRTAERRRPVDEFNNGVVMTNRALRDNEMFEIRIDELVNKWSGSIEMGVTTHSPDTLEFPATMTNLRSGTVMMSGAGIITNGKGTRKEYGQFNLDELREGDRIGLMRKSNGNLHYYVNGLDQGVAAYGIPSIVYGVVDLYGMTVKVTILNQSELSSPETNTANEPSCNTNNNNNDNIEEEESEVAGVDDTSDRRLLFHSRCGSHAEIINDGRTAHRPNALDDFNNAVVLTQRALQPDELFEVLIERLAIRWAGSIEIGVTTHSPNDLSFPSTMTNMRSGTWMMTGNGVMCNGTIVIDKYGQSLERLSVGDKVGVMRTSSGTLRFFVNGVDQGVAATGIPEKVYGVIDLYGQAAQASIVHHAYSPPPCLLGESSPNSGPNSCSLTLAPSSALATSASSAPPAMPSDLRFHHLHGKNARLINGGLTAVRPNAYGEFNDSILMSNRQLKDDELFEVVIEQMVDRWSGSIEAGVTAIPPEELNLPSTMTDIDHDTWMLSGSAIMQDGATVRNGYHCDLDELRVSSRIGMMRKKDGTLHYFLNGEDQGVACVDIPTGVFAVIDLYGQCSQVSLVQQPQQLSPQSTGQQAEGSAPVTVPCGPSFPLSSSESSALSPESLVVNASSSCAHIKQVHHLSPYCGKNVVLKNNSTTATRSRGYSHGLIFSAAPLETEELFEVQVEGVNVIWAGSLQIGLTTFVPPQPQEGCSGVLGGAFDLQGAHTWILAGSQVLRDGILIRDNYGPSLCRIQVGDRVGVRRSMEENIHFTINGEDLGPAATNIPQRSLLYVVLDLYGRTSCVSVCSSVAFGHAQHNINNNALLAAAATTTVGQFHELCGSNVQLANDGATAQRISSYHQGTVLSARPIPKGKLFQVCVDRLNNLWSGSLQIGVTSLTPKDYLSQVRKGGTTWLFSQDYVHVNGAKVKEGYGPNLSLLSCGHLIGILVDSEGQLHLFINGVDQGVAAQGLPSTPLHVIVDLYGQCDQVTIVDRKSSEWTEKDDQEKADRESDVTEKVGHLPIHPESNITKNCEYMSLCSRFRALVGLPEGFFQLDLSMCYCETCHKLRGDEPYYKKGEPPKDYALPFGWCRFTLRQPSKSQMASLWEKWHVAFHGTKVGAVRSILDHGDLLPIGQMGLGPFVKEPSSRRGKDKDLESCQVLLSPTLRYAGSTTFAPRQDFVDPRSHQRVQGRVAFQVYVRPGSYTVGPQRIGAREPIDCHFSNSDLEWHTKERGATVLHSLLVKVESSAVASSSQQPQTKVH